MRKKQFKIMGIPFKKYSKWDRFLGGFLRRKFYSNKKK